MSNTTADRRSPTLDREGDMWVLKVPGAGSVRVKPNGLAHQILEAANKAYWNGVADKAKEFRRALGLDP